MSEEEIKKALGPAMFSRIGCCVKYEDLTPEEKQKSFQIGTKILPRIWSKRKDVY